MSAEVAARAARRVPAPAAPNLRVVAPPARSRGFSVYIGACLSLLFGGSAVVLWLNTALAQGAFQIHEMEADLSNYTTMREATEETLTALLEPAALTAKAAELGMVPSHATGYLVLRDGAVVGLPPPPAGAGEPEGEPDGSAESGEAGAAGAAGEPEDG
ncbi:MAG: hypothetical protein LBL01_02060 [Bifidobacteriaceae bacterium]|jgi:hypothetical protein|nr:hypothetical protein [Bifidobacteriaceae bacterium]